MKSSLISNQEFVRHFHVMLPEDLQATQEDVRHYLCQVDLAPDGFQVGRTMVWLQLSAFNERSDSIIVVEFNLSEIRHPNDNNPYL